MNLKDKKLPLIVGGAAVVVILLLLIFMPSDKSGDQGPEVISKRVKIELQDTEADISASMESTIDISAPQALTTEVPPSMAQPSVAPSGMAKPRVVESTPAAKKAPVEKVKTETPKAVKGVKAVKKAAETKKVASAKRILPGSALVLNIASFSSLPEAQILVGKLKKAGYNAYITGFMKDSVRWHRVRVGFFSSRTEATRAGRAIQSKFRVDKPWIAKPDASELKAHL